MIGLELVSPEPQLAETFPPIEVAVNSLLHLPAVSSSVLGVWWPGTEGEGQGESS